MALAYETVLGEYRLKPTLRWVNRHSDLDPESRVYKALLEAAKIADEIKAPYEDFCRAQFYWVHRTQKRAAKPFELRGRTSAFPAKERYDEYKRRVESGEIPAVVESKVIRTAVITDQELDRINKTRLERLMLEWGLDEAQCIERFAPVGIFDTRWLIHNSVFNELKRLGRI